MMRRIAIILASLLISCMISAAMPPAETDGVVMFPMTDGAVLCSDFYGADGRLEARYSMTVRNLRGDLQDGGLDMVYCCHKSDGTPFFDSPNEFVMKVTRAGGQTSCQMEPLLKTAKVQDLLPVGDPSTVPSDPKVGQTLPDVQIHARLGSLKITVSVSERSVKDHKKITTSAGTFDCWLVHEKTITKIPAATITQSADTWYAPGIGSVRQKVYDSKGNLKSSQELTSVQ